MYSDSNDSTSKESEKVDWRAEAKKEKQVEANNRAGFKSKLTIGGKAEF